jgi:signal transduction histidine kinase
MGRGIPDDEKERVFARFHRVDTSVSGTGLGLYVVRFIANASGGRVWAENRVKGDHTKGTTMVVLLQKPDERQIAMMAKKSTGLG